VVSRIYEIVSGMSWKANSSMEKSQNSGVVGDEWMAFLEYLFPRLFPTCAPDLLASNLRARSRDGTHPDVKPTINKNEREAPLGVSQRDPHLAVHEKTMVHVDDPLFQTVAAVVDLLPLLALPPCEAVQAQRVSVFRGGNMFLSLV